MHEYKEHLHLIPEHMHGGMLRYIEKGIRPGDFLTAVLSNDLFGAVGRVDTTNRHRLFDYTTYLYNYAPGSCWGSGEAVKAWVESGGLEGQELSSDLHP